MIESGSNDNPKILIVDDEVEVLQSLVDLLRKEYHVYATTDAQKALDLMIADNTFSMVISDQRMPAMTGAELLASASRINPETARILLTGYSDIDAVIDAVNRGQIIQYITKPWDSVKLLAMLDSLQKVKLAQQEKIRGAQQWQLTFDSITDAVCLLDPEGRILKSNASFRQLAGKSDSDITGRFCYQVIHETDNFSEDCPFPRALKSWQKESNDLNIGSCCYNAKVDLASNEAGEVTSFVCTLRDMSEQKLLEEKLIQSQKMEAIGQLAGGVAHDFNNMLGVIVGHTELALRKAPPSSPLISDLEEIRKAANRSADLTRQLLTFARKQVIATDVLDLNEAVAGTLTMLQRLIGENIQLSWNPASNLWPVTVDPSQLAQILTNLCVNSRDAISGAGKISIKTANTSWDEEAISSRPYDVVPGDYVLLSVSDDGCGMDEKAQTHIFEPFYTTKDVGSGTGLGLATVYGAVKQNHGFLTVYSEPELGTVFNIYFPRTIEAVEGKQETSETQLLGGTETILLVEDNEMLLSIAKSMLEESGYTVLSAITTDLAQSFAKKHTGPIHLLISDVIMPVMNGKELSEKLMPFQPDMKVLFLSGYTADIISNQGVIEDEIHFLQKPFSLEALTSKVREVLDSH